MIERVARVLWRYDHTESDENGEPVLMPTADRMWKAWEEDYLARAKEVLEAMKEPTYGMVQAAVVEWEQDYTIAEAIYTTMITAALGEE